VREREYRATLKRARQGDVVRARWRDASRVHNGWSTIPDYLDTLDVMRKSLEETTGYFVGSNDAYVLVALNANWQHDSEPYIADGMAIPHEMIRTFEILVPGSKLDRSPTRQVRT